MIELTTVAADDEREGEGTEERSMQARRHLGVLCAPVEGTSNLQWDKSLDSARVQVSCDAHGRYAYRSLRPACE